MIYIIMSECRFKEFGIRLHEVNVDREDINRHLQESVQPSETHKWTQLYSARFSSVILENREIRDKKDIKLYLVVKVAMRYSTVMGM